LGTISPGYDFFWVQLLQKLFLLNWTMTFFPVSIGPLHTCRAARIFELVASTKMSSIFLEQIRNFFFEWVNKISRVGTKI
jgi:hypothetical protein